jgi:ABC-type polysaccharide/polyol phosphate transport system ATPase subunit
MSTRCVAVSLKNVSKSFPLYSGSLEKLRGYFGIGNRRVQQKLALDGVTLSILHGERVGVIGHNGSGKTTLLRAIIGFTPVTTGQVTIDGSVQALMQTGYGFNDDLTGLENIRNALVFNGLTKAEMAQAEADIVEFVELGVFLFHPVKTYSLGMRTRLEFAVATAIRPDVLAIDEVLGAGDGYFVRKCALRMRNLIENTTLLLVSHSLDQIREYCDRVIWMDSGRVRDDGSSETVLAAYRAYMADQSARLRSPTVNQLTTASTNKSHKQLLKRVATLFGLAVQGPSRISLFAFTASKESTRVMETGEPLELSLEVQASVKTRPVVLGLSEQGAFVFEIDAGPQLLAGDHSLLVRQPRFGAGVGHYVLVAALREIGSGRLVVIGDSTLELQMAPTNWSDPPMVHLDGRWTADVDGQRVPIDGKVSAWV